MRSALLLLPLLAAGCNTKATAALGGYPRARVENATDARSWTGASAPNMYFSGLVPAVGLDSKLPDGGASDCPKVTRSATGVLAEGGCTDALGQKWFGSLEERLDGADAGTGTLTYSAYGNEGTTECGGQMLMRKQLHYGSMVISPASDGVTFQIDLYSEYDGAKQDCTPVSFTTAVSYQGSHRTGDVWSGKGQLGSSQLGKVSAETRDEVLAGPCSFEAESGSTTLDVYDGTIVYTYDGATKCDATSTVRWSKNGMDEGELTGVQCSSGSGLALALACLALRRRRR